MTTEFFLRYLTVAYYCQFFLSLFFFITTYAKKKPRELYFLLFLAGIIYVQYNTVTTYYLNKQTALRANMFCTGVITAKTDEYMVVYDNTHRWYSIFPTQNIAAVALFSVGDSVSITLPPPSLPNKETDSALFDSFFFYKIKENVCAYYPKQNNYPIKLLRKNSTPLTTYFYTQKNKLSLLIHKLFSHNTSLLIRQVFLGEKLPDHSFDAVCQLWGISHYLARSGLHFSIISLVLFIALSLIPIGQKKKLLIIFSLLFAYFLFSYSSISVYRTFCYMTLYFLLQFCNQRPHNKRVFIAVFLITLLQNPVACFFLDCQLTFFFTAFFIFGFV